MRYSRDHRRSARWGAATVCLSVLCVTLAGCSTVSAMNLEVGQCVSVPAQEATASVSRVDCTAAHQAEVVAVLDIPTDTLPPVSELDIRATSECAAAFESYVGISQEDSALSIFWLRPSVDSWEAGDHAITCLAQRSDGTDLTASIRDSRM